MKTFPSSILISVLENIFPFIFMIQLITVVNNCKQLMSTVSNMQSVNLHSLQLQSVDLRAVSNMQSVDLRS